MTVLCPKCGKPMEESPQWEGAFQCPDYKTPINKDGPPFRYKCYGMLFTEAAERAFEIECAKIIAERN